MKILIAGSWAYSMYEEAFAEALTSLDCEVIKFSWDDYFKSFIGKAENKYILPGPFTRRLNKELLNKVYSSRPDAVLVWRGTHIWPATLKKMKKFGIKALVSYNHDDFTGVIAGAPVPLHHHLLWRHFLACAQYYDAHFVKRDSNVSHLASLGCKNIHIMPMWFVPAMHKPMELSKGEKERYSCDIVFAGHYEPDGREGYLRALVDAGLNVRLFGGKYWTKKVLGDLFGYFGNIFSVYGEDYAKALCGAKICLVFLSKLNRDTYTRRCFEIPACGRVMLAERTDDLLNLFKEDEEACFFSSQDELVNKAKWLVNNPDIREKIAKAGLRRVWADRHDVKTRVAAFLSVLGLS